MLGHPRGLAYLVFAESWERFSYYGMQALLVLYMGQYLLLPEHTASIAGFGPFHATIAVFYGTLDHAALASIIFGLYSGGVYLTPIAGGLLADRVLGRTATVTLGAVLMAGGYFLLAFEQSFLVALACLLIGVGCFKGNIASQVGELYAPGDTRRADAFQIFQLGVSAAVIFAPLIIGTLGEKYAWRWGFDAAGVGMLLGLAVYLAGRRYLPAAAQPHGTVRASRPKLAPGEAATVLVLLALLPAFTLAMVANQEIFNAYILWGDAHYDLQVFGRAMPVTWLLSLDAFTGVVVSILTVAFWRWWARRYGSPTEITRAVIGAFIMAMAPLLLALASAQAGGAKIGLPWALGFHAVIAIGFMNLFPVGLALYSRAAPHAVSGLMIGVFYLHLFLCNMLVGWLGSLLERMPPARFWLLHAALVAGGGALMLIFRAAFNRRLAPIIDPEAA